jgi:hypothetical protein
VWPSSSTIGPSESSSVYSPGATWYGERGTQKALELISSTAFESGVVAMYCKPT